MTKQWNLHEATIKKLYAENTLAVVRKIMIEEYNFKASTRAYRGRLVKWRMRKYNCRRRSDCSSTILSADSPDGSMSGSDAASPMLSQPTVRSNHDLSRYSDDGHVRDYNEPTMSNPLERPYNPLEMDTSRSNTENYYRDRAIVPPAEKMHYGWNMPPSQPTSPMTFDHAGMVGASAPVYGYVPLPLPPAPSTYPTTAYESGDANRDTRRQGFPLMPGQQYGAIHDQSNCYPPIQGYGHGHTSEEIGSLYHVRKDC
ncbi:hypothetical protein F5B17DRAFT_118654 [Nemania serpens]|nr:hypothetical protein F5B17DRAFT_118654 [Nemania serpens]